MVTFKLISVIDGFYHYEVYPEGKTEHKGTVVFNLETKEIREFTNPGKPYDRYNWIGKASEGFKDKDGNILESGMVAWY